MQDIAEASRVFGKSPDPLGTLSQWSHATHRSTCGVTKVAVVGRVWIEAFAGAESRG